MSKKLGQDPAFPSEYLGSEKDEFGMPTIVHRKCYGISKRLYLAGMAMQGLLAGNYEWCHEGTLPVSKPIPSYIACLALECADELLKQIDG